MIRAFFVGLVFVLVALVAGLAQQATREEVAHPPHPLPPVSAVLDPGTSPDYLSALETVVGGALAAEEEHDAIAAWVAIQEDQARPRIQTRPTSSCGSDWDCFAACTRAHESDTAGGYSAVSPGGSYRGAYQFALATWRSVAVNAGFGEWADVPVDQVPAGVQDAVARFLWEHSGNQPWGGRC